MVWGEQKDVKLRYKIMTIVLVFGIIAVLMTLYVWFVTAPERRAVEEASRQAELAKKEAQQQLQELDTAMQELNRMN